LCREAASDFNRLKRPSIWSSFWAVFLQKLVNVWADWSLIKIIIEGDLVEARNLRDIVDSTVKSSETLNGDREELADLRDSLIAGRCISWRRPRSCELLPVHSLGGGSHERIGWLNCIIVNGPGETTQKS
jgi:hypothetical protein